MLELRGVGKRYGPVRVLSEVSFTVAPGEVLAVCGQNGAGKSTLMNILAGVLPHGSYQGEVRLHGEELAMRGPADAERRGIGLLPQELTYYPDLSITENVLATGMPSRWGAVDRAAAARRARELCDEVGLSAPVDLPLRRLEVADRQLVCIARGLSVDPRVLVLDEPTAALPSDAAERLFTVVRQLAAEGRAVLYVSHHLSELAGLATHVAVLRNGWLVLPPTRSWTVPDIVTAMVGPEPGSTPSQPAAPGPAPAAAAPDAPAPDAPGGGPPGAEVLRARVRAVRRAGHEVVSGVELTVQAGEIVGLAGLTGSGREELVQTLAGAPPGQVDGSVAVAGRPVVPLQPATARAAGVAFVPADRRADGLLPLQSASANLLVGFERLAARWGIRLPGRERSTVRQALAAFQVRPPDPDKPAALFSGGNQQKLVLGRAALRAPRVLVLAEPSRGVDVSARAAVHEAVRDAARRAGVIVASSDVAELVELADRVVVLWHGRVLAELRGGELTESKLLAAVNGHLET